MLKSKSFIILTLLMFLGFSSKAQNFDSFFEKGQENLTKRNYKKALLYFDSAIILKPQFPNTYINRALVKNQLEDLKGAINDLNSYVVLVPNDADAYDLRAQMKNDYNDTVGALIDFDLSILLDPNNYRNRLTRGKYFASLNYMLLAKQDFNHAYKLDSTIRDVVYYKGITHYYLDELDSALKYLYKCIQFDSTDERSYYFIAKNMYFKKDYFNALKNINIAVRLNPNDSENLVARALIYMYNENQEDDYLAKVDLYKALEMGSSDAKIIIEKHYSEGEDEEDPN